MSKKRPIAHCLTISVSEAGARYFGLGRTASYKAAARGELPTVKVGTRLRVVVAHLDALFEQAGAHLQRPNASDRDPHLSGAGRDAT